VSLPTTGLLTTSLPASGNFNISRFNIDFGGRGENHSRELFRAVVGAQGSFTDTWSYNVAFNYGRVETFYQTRGNVHLARFTNAVNAVRNTAGQIVCSINNDASTTRYGTHTTRDTTKSTRNSTTTSRNKPYLSASRYPTVGRSHKPTRRATSPRDASNPRHCATATPDRPSPTRRERSPDRRTV
jgi:hypothetical protein